MFDVGASRVVGASGDLDPGERRRLPDSCGAFGMRRSRARNTTRGATKQRARGQPCLERAPGLTSRRPRRSNPQPRCRLGCCKNHRSDQAATSYETAFWPWIGLGSAATRARWSGQPSNWAASGVGDARTECAAASDHWRWCIRQPAGSRWRRSRTALRAAGWCRGAERTPRPP